MVFLSRNHKGCKICSVDSQKHDREQRPNAGHEPEKFSKVLMRFIPLLGVVQILTWPLDPEDSPPKIEKNIILSKVSLLTFIQKVTWTEAWKSTAQTSQ